MNNYKDFESWFHEQENYSSRAERCYDDYTSHHNLDRFKNLRKWLEAAFMAARLQTKYVLDVKGSDDDLYLDFPEELIKSQGWEVGTALQWVDNGNGSWTIKAKS